MNNKLENEIYHVTPNINMFRIGFIIIFIYLTLNFIGYYRKSRDKNFLFPASFFGIILFSLSLDEFYYWVEGLYNFYPDNTILIILHNMHELIISHINMVGNIMLYALLFSLVMTIIKFNKIRTEYKILKENN